MESITLSPAFTPLPGLVGGALIGAICVARLHALGRLSGLAVDTLFVPGLLLGGAYAAFRTAPDAFVEGTTLPAWKLLLAGALVGVGVPMGKGCTSGNGVLGLGCLSVAGLVNVVAFMLAAAAAATWTGASESVAAADGGAPPPWTLALPALAGVLAMRPLRRAPPVADLVAGAAFACALALSGMTKASKVLGFLEPTRRDGWDPTLACVMGGAVCVSLPGVAFGIAFGCDGLAAAFGCAGGLGRGDDRLGGSVALRGGGDFGCAVDGFGCAGFGRAPTGGNGPVCTRARSSACKPGSTHACVTLYRVGSSFSSVCTQNASSGSAPA